MKSEARNRLRNIVGKARKLVEEDIQSQLLRLGIKENELIPIGRLEHLDDSLIENRRRIEEAIQKEKLGNLSEKEGFERYVLHVGFTFINRVAAFKAMEARNLLSRETITRKEKYAGYSAREYEVSEREGINDPGEIANIAFREACEEISEEIAVLFDLSDEYSILFPSARVLTEVYEYFGKDIPDEDWLSDDVIGWIYQYYNSEVRKEYRKKRIKPKAEDIPILTQFYTPDWIVSALVDNSLGRLWLEMETDGVKFDGDNARIKKSRYEFIKKHCPMLIFPKNEFETKNINIREIKILDPACGSGHFLVYAFDVLYQMYLEQEPNTSIRQIPSLIIENNLFGLDIDLRAVQLAALSLYLKAKSYNPKLIIKNMHLVSSDVRMIDGTIRDEFLSKFDDNPELSETLSSLLDSFICTPEAGSLVRVRGPLKEMVERGKQPFQTDLLIENDTVDGVSQISASSPHEGVNFEMMIDALRAFENEGIETNNMGTLLFAGEAEKSLGLISVLAQEYDTILMNPPHSRPPDKTKQYLKQHYPKTKVNLYSAFLELGIDLCKVGGFIAAVLGRPLLTTKSFQHVRRNLLSKKAIPELVLDLGFYGFEEAHAQFTALTLKRVSQLSKDDLNIKQVVFVRLTDSHYDTKRIDFEKAISNQQDSDRFYIRTLSSFNKVPLQAYTYWAPDFLIDQFDIHPPLDKDLAGIPFAEKIADVKQGLATGDNRRFLRFWWEVPVKRIASSREETMRGKKWVPFVDEFYLFYFFQDLQQVINWDLDGKEIRNFNGAVIRNDQYYFSPGLTWSATLQRTQLPSLWSYKRLPFRVLPKGCIFGVCAQGVLLPKKQQWTVLGMCVSRFMFAVSRLTTSDNKQGTGSTAKLPIALVPKEKTDETTRLASLSKEAHDILREWETGNEPSTLFIEPLLLQVMKPGLDDTPPSGHPFASKFEWAKWASLAQARSICTKKRGISDLFETYEVRHDYLISRFNEILEEIDSIVNRFYKISDKYLEIVEREIDLQQSFDTENRKNPNLLPDLTIADEVNKLLSFYVKQCMEADSDGIVSLVPNTSDNIYKSIHHLVCRDFGDDNTDAFYREVGKILGKSVDEWILTDYFNFHILLYRNTPIYWHITSANLGHQSNANGGFNCLISYHKLDKDTLPKIHVKHLRPLLDGLKLKNESLQRIVDEGTTSSAKNRDELERAAGEMTELKKLDDILKELSKPSERVRTSSIGHRWTDEKITEILERGWTPVIDYGVRVNIKPLQDAGILHKAARRIK